MISLLTFFLVVVISILVVRIATVALVLTGLSNEFARFQARSAFTGAGFTTSESEQVVRHPIRRRIIMMLMLLGNAGMVSSISTLVLSFALQDDPQTYARNVILLALGCFSLWLFVRSRWIDRVMQRLIGMALKHWTDLDVWDYAQLFRLSGDYAVVELFVQADSWFCGKRLIDMKLTHEDILVLGIDRGDKRGYVGAPKSETRVMVGDTLIIYGRQTGLSGLNGRPLGDVGDQAHERAVTQCQRTKQTDE